MSLELSYKDFKAAIKKYFTAQLLTCLKKMEKWNVSSKEQSVIKQKPNVNVRNEKHKNWNLKKKKIYEWV